MNVAAGLTGGTAAEALLRHAAGCDHCGPLLRESLADFTLDVTPDEEELLDGLRSSQRDWQQQMAARLCERRKGLDPLAWLRRYLPAFGPIPKWAYAVAGVAVIAAGLMIYTREQPVENLLAAAYTSQRTFELRIPGADYGPVRMVRGGDQSRLDRPPALLQSEARIAHELIKNPGSPRWLQARGRAELLDRDFDSALADLRRCLALQPDSPLLMTDLASAYFQRAEANNSQADYTAASELLSRVLKTIPDDPVALFNRAVVYQRMQLHDRAVEDWRHYLRADPNSTWVPEARRHLDEAEQAAKKTS